MLGQVRAVRKAFAALIAYVGLRTFVHVHVRRQGGFDGEPFAALWADVLSRSGVRGLVVLQLLFRDEAFFTSRKSALMGLVTGMAVDVSCQFRLVAERVTLAAAGPVAVVVTTWLAVALFSSVVPGNMSIEVFCGRVMVVA